MPRWPPASRIGDPRRVADLRAEFAQAVLAAARERIEDAVDRIKIEAGDVPLVAVGGGAFLVPDRLAGASRVIRYPMGSSQRGRRRDRTNQRRDRPDLPRSRPGGGDCGGRSQARERAVAAGADRETLETVDVEDMPLAYLPGNALRVRVRVAGEMRAAAAR